MRQPHVYASLATSSRSGGKCAATASNSCGSKKPLTGDAGLSMRISGSLSSSPRGLRLALGLQAPTDHLPLLLALGPPYLSTQVETTHTHLPRGSALFLRARGYGRNARIVKRAG